MYIEKLHLGYAVQLNVVSTGPNQAFICGEVVHQCPNSKRHPTCIYEMPADKTTVGDIIWMRMGSFMLMGGQQRTKDTAVKRKWKVSALVIKPIYSGMFERNTKALSEALVLYIMLHFVHMWLVWKEASKYTLSLSKPSVSFSSFLLLLLDKKSTVMMGDCMYLIRSFIINPLYMWTCLKCQHQH